MNKQRIYLSITKGSYFLFFQFCIHLMNLHISLAFLPPGFGSVSVHADPDPGGISLCGSRSETLIWIIPMLFKHIWKLLNNTILYNQSKRRIYRYQLSAISISHYQIQYYSLFGLKN